MKPTEPGGKAPSFRSMGWVVVFPLLMLLLLAGVWWLAAQFLRVSKWIE